jgi:signal transduction histidine kinase
VTQVEVLRRGAADDHPLLAVELGRIREMLHGEVLNLRETMRRMGAWRVTSAGLVKHLAETVDRFQRDTGAAARFWSDLGPEDIRLAPRACREVAQILIEALVNVRKHSGATRVLVSMTGFNDHLRLSVEDDGRGFPFSGQRSRDELEADRTGPRVIAERTRVIGADLLVESKPGAGARLVVSWPR